MNWKSIQVFEDFLYHFWNHKSNFDSHSEQNFRVKRDFSSSFKNLSDLVSFSVKSEINFYVPSLPESEIDEM